LGSAATDDRERFQIAPFNGIWSIDTSDILVNRGVGHRPLGGGGHILFDFRNEFDAQVSPFTFIPCCRFDELCARRSTKQHPLDFGKFSVFDSPKSCSQSQQVLRGSSPDRGERVHRHQK
jgi:hypothetical protein